MKLNEWHLCCVAFLSNRTEYSALIQGFREFTMRFCKGVGCALVLTTVGLCLASQMAAQSPTTSSNQTQPKKEAPIRHPHEPEDAAPPAAQDVNSLLKSEAESEDIRNRERWFYSQRAFPLKHIPGGAWARASKQRGDMIRVQSQMGLLREVPLALASIGFPGPTTWTVIGPQPLGVPPGHVFTGTPYDSGRVQSIVVDPTNAEIAYTGAATGGVWKTTDAGAHWTPLTDNFTPAIGAVAIDPSSCSPAPCKIIYAGTGEGELSDDSYWGQGVLKSTDAGSTWTLLGQSTFAGPFSSAGFEGLLDGGFRIASVAVDPFASTTILVAAQRYTSLATSGIYRSTDGGNTWTLVNGGTFGTGVVFDPVNAGIAYATLGSPLINPASLNPVFKSSDHGATWTAIPGTSPNILPTTNIGRTELALAPSSPTTMFLSIATANPIGSLLGVFKTTDGGQNWTPIPISSTPPNLPDYCNNQCWYDHVIRVSPTNSNVVFVGGTENGGQSATAFRSLDGGATWSPADTGASSTSLHTDVHALAFSKDGGRLYIGNDGGVWRSDNPAAALGTYDLINLNATLALTQFYPGQGDSPSDENMIWAGTQDNGIDRFTGNLLWDQLMGGDFMNAVIDQKIPSTAFFRSGFTIFRTLQIDFTPGSGGLQITNTGIDTMDRADFPPLVGDPNMGGVLYFGTYRIYQTTSNGDLWTPISQDLAGGTAAITAIAVAPGNSNVVYVGTDQGIIQQTSNALAGTASTWTNVTTADLPARFITAIAVDEHNSNAAVVTFSGFSGFNGDTKGHVFLTTNGGASWTDIRGTGASALPNTPANDIVIDPDVANTLYLATDLGVFTTSNDNAGSGTVWSPLGTGLPESVVTSLRLRRASRTLRAGTHGRSMWLIQLTNFAPPAGPLFTSISPALAPANSASLGITLDGASFTTQSVVQWDGSQTGISTVFVSANRLTATIDTSLLGAPGMHNIQVFDASQTPNTSGTLRFAVLSPRPSIQTISPSSASAGGPAFTLTANGTNFASNSVVRFGGANETTTFLSSTQLTASIPASAVANSGAPLVTVLTPAPGGGTSNGVTFTIGTGVGNGTVTLSPTSLSFASQLVTTSGPAQMITLSNTGNASLTIASITVTGANSSDFPETTTCPINPATLAAGQNCIITVIFKPTSAGNLAASVSVTDNATGSPQTVPLTGTGTDFSLSAAAGGSTSATVTAGQTATYNLQLTATSPNPFSGGVTLSCSGAPSLASCAALPATVILGSGATTAPFTVTVTTTVPSMTPLRIEPRYKPPLTTLRLWTLVLLALAVMLLAGLVATRRLRPVFASTTLALIVLFLALVGGCGGGIGGGGSGGPHSPGTPSGTSTVTITGSNGGVSRTLNLTLTVK